MNPAFLHHPAMRRFLAVARKEFLHVLRDPRALGVSLALPLVLLLLFGYALTLDVDRVPLAVWDQSRTPQSRELISRFEGSRYFSVVSRPETYREIERAMDHGEIMLALVLPVDFGHRVGSERPTQVQVLADGSDSNTATLALNYAQALVQSHSGQLLEARMLRRLGSIPRPALDVRARAWFNPDMESRIFIVPGLIAVIMMLITALLTSLTMAREWETGTMEQLIATPVRGPELILGKLTPYFAVGMVDMAISVAAGYWLFRVPMRGSLVLLFVVAAVFLLGALALGILISAVAKAQLLASQMAFVLTYLPAFLLSGFMFDVANMPTVLRLITHIIPARHFVTFLRALYLKGAGPRELWFEMLFLTLFALAMLALAMATFKKRLD